MKLRNPALLCVIGALALLPPAEPASAASAEPERRFLWQQANAQLAAARTPADYRAAAAVLGQLVDAGARNGTLFYNLGTALLKGERYPEAAAAFARAERYEGSLPDTRHNLRIAYARAEGNEDADLPWYRGFLFWHYRLPCSTRFALLSLAFLGLWLALARRQIGPPRPGLGVGLLLCIVLVMILTSSVAVTVQAELRADAAPPAQTSGPPN